MKVRGIVAVPVVGHPLERPQGERSQGDDVVPVVRQHRFHRVVAPVTKEVEEDLGDAIPRDVVVTLDFEDFPFERREPGVFVPRLEQPARRVEQIQVARAAEGRAKAGQREAGLEQGKIETAPVVGDEIAAAGNQHRQFLEHGGFPQGVAHEELRHPETVLLDVADPDQKGEGARTAREPARFGVEKKGAREVHSGLSRTDVETRGLLLRDLGEPEQVGAAVTGGQREVVVFPGKGLLRC